MNRQDIPNLISFLRMALVVPIVILLMAHEFRLSLLLFAIAGISDALDGYIAKRYGWTSTLGGMLDPLADKVLLVSCYLVLGTLGLVPGWLVAIVIGRDMAIVGGAIVYHFTVEQVQAAPTRISKLNTTAQILLVLMLVWDQGVFALPDDILHAMVYIVLATTVLSGIDYIYTWGLQGWRRRRDTAS